MLVLVTTVHECEVDEFTGSKIPLQPSWHGLGHLSPLSLSKNYCTYYGSTVGRGERILKSHRSSTRHAKKERVSSIRTDVWRMCDHTLTFALGSADRRALQNLSEATNLLVAL